jgi:hypothetical protein
MTKKTKALKKDREVHDIDCIPPCPNCDHRNAAWMRGLRENLWNWRKCANCGEERRVTFYKVYLIQGVQHEKAKKSKSGATASPRGL